jgi:hypothetical protein
VQNALKEKEMIMAKTKTECRIYGHDLDTSKQPIKCRRCDFSYYGSCTIQRRFVRTIGITLDFETSAEDRTNAKSETVIEACNVPLFGDIERKTGICRTCAKGWQHPHNIFASDAERARAQGADADLLTTEDASSVTEA